MTDWLINGKPSTLVSIEDRGLRYADGLFETIAVRDGRARFLSYHLERLAEGCRRLSLPGSAGPLVQREIEQLVCRHTSATGKIIITRGAGPRGYTPPEHPEITRIIGVENAPEPARNRHRDGIAVRTCRTPVGVNPATAGLKTLGRLDQVLARSEWHDPAVPEGLMASPDGRIISGTMTNLFIVAGGRLRTPALTDCGIRGVMRRVVLEEAAQSNIECAEVSIYAEDLARASEMFLTNSLIGIWPIVKLENQSFAVGPLTRRLMARLAARGVRECRI